MRFIWARLTPAEFKDMRKAWRKKKREATAAAANSQYLANAGWNRASLSSSSESEDYDRRPSSSSYMPSDYSYDSRPNTASSVASSIGYPSQVMNDLASRRGSGMIQPGTLPMPMPQQAMTGFKFAEGDHPTPTPQNPFAGTTQPQAVRNAFPFQTLTQPMPMPTQYGQFAFQR